MTVGEEVTHTIVIKNKGPKTAAEVNVKEELGNDFGYISATVNQGICKQSTKSSGRVVCHLGSLPAGATATITVVPRLRNNPLTKDGSEMGNSLEINFKENPTDFVEANNQVFRDFSTTVTSRPSVGRHRSISPSLLCLAKVQRLKIAKVDT